VLGVAAMIIVGLVGLAALLIAIGAWRRRVLARRVTPLVDNELVTLTGLALLHAAHSAWMIVLLLGLDGRVHLKRILAAGLAEIPTPGVLAISSVIALYAGRVLVMRLLANEAHSQSPSIVRVIE
jgi:hypothetical protein